MSNDQLNRLSLDLYWVGAGLNAIAFGIALGQRSGWAVFFLFFLVMWARGLVEQIDGSAER